MRRTQIKKLLARDPLRPLEILLDAGERVAVRHRESIVLVRNLIVFALRDDTVDFVEPRNVSRIRFLPRGNGRT